MRWRMDQHPSDTEGIKMDRDSAPATKAADAAESIASPLDPMAQLQADIQAAKAEVAEWQDRFLRKAAEFENYRKRAEKEKSAESMWLAKSVVIEFLPIADACERALKMLADSRNAPGNLQQYQDGVELLYRQVIDALNRVGVVAVEAEGKTFDPHLHEALSREETPDFKEGMVVRELRRGYIFKEKLLRPAQVIVSARPQGKDSISQ
jgi:molecular chaperone GrpE